MSISAICACKNRNLPLRVSLNSWLNFKEIDEIIIVDWSSDEPLDYLTKLDSRIKVIRVSDKKYFNQPQPLNLAASLASGDYILKLDTDYVVNPYYNFIEKYFPGENSFTSGVHNIQSPEYYDESTGLYMIDKSRMSNEQLREYFDSYSPYFKYLTGFLFVSKENFNKVGGYNEDFGKYYAFEDSEIYKRLENLGLTHNKMEYDYNLFHIPHPDTKRVENFEGYHEKNDDQVSQKDWVNSLQSDTDKWQVEYFISQSHIKINEKKVGEINCVYIEPKTNWNIIRMDEQHYFAEDIKIENSSDEVYTRQKLNGFPTVHYVSLEESYDRRQELERKFSEYGIKPKPIISKKFAECDDVLTGEYLYQLNDGTKGCCVSHLKAIKEWYETTDDDYGFFCEDDLSLETVKYWNFNWEEFVSSIPDDAECVQLFTIRGEYDTFKIRERYWDDWGATAYILTRDYAEKVIKNYIKEDSYHLEIPNSTVMPLIENILFTSIGKTYTIPLFVENINFKSTFENEDDDVNEGQKTNHRKSRDLVLNYWQSVSPKLNAQDKKPKKSEIENLLTEYSLDTENAEHNFALGLWYEKEGHTAPALSYFLRCAERSEDNDLAYEALIKGSHCYERQGERGGSARGMLFQAQAFRPDRPEAYYLLSNYARKREWWQDCYLNADLGLRFCDFNLPPLRTDIGYPGRYGLLYEKALSSWWWGKGDQSREILESIKENYELPENDYNAINEALEKMGGSKKVQEPKQEEVKIEVKDFNYPENFNWSDLTYEDIITIEREVVHEKVYRFWKDVKKDDVVLDIGASVGAYTISILDQKPKKVYCVEPSKKLLKTLVENCYDKVLEYKENPLVCINCGIVDNEGDKINIFGGDNSFSGMTFKKLIEDYSIDHIDYMKIDCEGGEYSIFREENMDFLLNKVDFIAMEVHLNYEGCREKFKNLRDKYLIRFKNYKVMSCTRQNISWGNSIDIKNRIFDNKFIDEYTCEFMVYISKN
jgi:FkbM family methyltransferase